MSEIVDFDVKAYPSYPAGQVVLLTVLTQRIEGTFKAYAAIVPDNSKADPLYRGTINWARSNGNPLRYEDAARIFPHFNLQKKDYAK